MKRDFAIRIFHNTTNKIEFLFWAELFRLCGVFVGEGLLSDRVGDEGTEKKRKQDADDDCFQFFLIIGNRADAVPYREKLPWEELTFTEEIFDEKLQGSEGVAWPAAEYEQNVMLENVEKSIGQIEEAISKRGYFQEDSDFWADFRILANIYLKYNLLLYSMNLQFYHYDIKDVELLLDVENSYYKAYREIVEMDRVTPTIRYASLFCGYKTNDAAQLKGRPARVAHELLVRQCQKLCEEYSEFINARVLLGLIFSSSKENAAESIEAFSVAVDQLNEACFCSHIYYWIANRWEQVEGKNEEAEKNYLLAYQRKPKYRNIYKLGALAADRDEHELACRRYEELIDRLEIRIHRDFADPLELHYYIKTCSILGDIYRKKERKYSKAAYIYEKGREAYEKSYHAAEEGRDFFVRFYGSEWRKYRKVTDLTVRIEVIYEKAFDVYSLLQDVEKIQEYRELLRDGKEPFVF